MFYLRFFFYKNFEKMSQSLIFANFLFFGERCEWIAHFAQIKWAMWANRSFCSPKMSDHEQFTQVTQRKWENHWFRSPKKSELVNRSFFWANCSFANFWTKKEQFARKSNERIPSPDIYKCIDDDTTFHFNSDPKPNSYFNFHL